MTVQTNGVLLTQESHRRKLLEARPMAVAVSLDGLSEDAYARVRTTDKWPAIKKGILDFLEERARMGLKDQVQILLSSIVPKGGSQETLDRNIRFLDPLPEKADRLQMIDLDDTYEPEFFTRDGGMETTSKSVTVPDKKALFCREPLEKAMVLYGGRVVPCCYDINGEFVMGSINGKTIDEIWNSDAFVKLQEAMILHRVQHYPWCARCKLSP